MKLLEMSVSAGVLVLFLLLMRTFVCSKLPKQVFALCWMIVLVRLFLPVNLPFQKGIATPAVSLMQRVMQRQDTGKQKSAGRVVQEAASSGIAEHADFSRFGFTLKIPVGLCYLWLVGAVLSGMYFVWCFRKEQRFLSQAIPLECLPAGSKRTDGPNKTASLEELYTSVCRVVGCRQQGRNKGQILTHDRLATPLVQGVVHQRIVIPKEMLHMEDRQMQFVLAHEMVHIKKRDNLWKLLSAAAVSLHWFNPAVWIMHDLLAKDLELSCDERVLALYGRKNRENYAMTLLMLAQNQKETMLFSSGFGKNPTKERIESIMKYEKISKIGSAGAVMMLAGAITIFAANDQAAASERQQERLQTETESYLETKTADFSGTDTDVNYKLFEVSEDGEAKEINSELNNDNTVEEITEEFVRTNAESESGEPGSQEAALTYYVGTDKDTGLNENGEVRLEANHVYLEQNGEAKELDLENGDKQTVTVDGKKYQVSLLVQDETENIFLQVMEDQ